jgi:hypothetical protein
MDRAMNARPADAGISPPTVHIDQTHYGRGQRLWSITVVPPDGGGWFTHSQQYSRRDEAVEAARRIAERSNWRARI